MQGAAVTAARRRQAATTQSPIHGGGGGGGGVFTSRSPNSTRSFPSPKWTLKPSSNKSPHTAIAAHAISPTFSTQAQASKHSTNHNQEEEQDDDEEDDDVFHDTHEYPHSKKKKIHIPHLFPNSIRRPCGTLVNNLHFQTFIILLIVINSIMMGIATYDMVETNPTLSQSFAHVDLTFLILFTAELLLQIIYQDVRIFLDGWLVFDFVVVLFSWTFATVKVMRAFRIFRAFRLIGRIKVLRVLVDALLSVIPRLASIGLLLSLLFYIFGVMFTQLFMYAHTSSITSENYFGTLDVSLFTLFQMMTMDGWAPIAREVMVVYRWAWAPFVVFVVLSGFVVVNLVIAVICDAIFILHELEEESNGGGGDNSDGDLAFVEEEEGGDDKYDAEKGESNAQTQTQTQKEQKWTVEEEVQHLTKQVNHMLAAQQEILASFEQMIVQLQAEDAMAEEDLGLQVTPP